LHGWFIGHESVRFQCFSRKHNFLKEKAAAKLNVACAGDIIITTVSSIKHLASAAVGLCSLLLAIPLLPVVSHAQDVAKSGSDGWTITLGATVEYGPSYPGAKHNAFGGLPSFDIRRMGEPAGLSAPDDNLDYTLFQFHGFDVGPVVGLRGGRSASDDWRLTGLNDVNWNIDAGVFVQYWPIEDRLRLRAETRQALWGRDGLVADLSIDWFQPITSDLVLSAGPRASLANSTYMHNNFGISAQEAAKNGRLGPFDAGAGLKSIGFSVAATYTVSPHWSIQVYDRYDRLVNDAASSPITSIIGNRDQNVVGFSINRSFDVGF
jgi:outer membrane scaffolding protein for murein synthesis (MipA/OmpV family)